MRRAFRIVGACGVVVGLGWAAAQEAPRPKAAADAKPAPTAARESDDLRALRELTGKFTAAYNAGDAAALAALFTEDAEIVGDDGSVTSGREAIAERFAATFEDDPGATLALQTESVRLLGADSALEKGTATLTPADGAAPEAARYTVVYVKRDGAWLHAVVRDDPAAEPTHHEQLKQLEWMVGEWVNESDDAVVSTTCRWTEDGNFLVRDFDVKIAGRVALRGTQRIGWDPLHKQPRTWVFDTEGGFAEGLMARHGNQWLVKATGVRPDGKPASATSIITLWGPDRVGWQVADRTVGGLAVPDIDQFIMVRKPPAPAR
jgi:uncharacterized protein (TIGR02246 family)